MKKTAYYYLSLAAIVAGGLVSCQDEDQGFDYETVRGSVYAKKFVSEFGSPAPDHKWGFDAASLFMGVSNPQTRASERFSKKQNMQYEGIPVTIAFGQPTPILKGEHEEVTAWFKNHRVSWTNTPAEYTDASTQGTGVVAECMDTTYPGYGSLTTYSANNSVLGDYSYSNNFLFHNAWLQHVSSYSDNDRKPASGTSYDCYYTVDKPIMTYSDHFYYKMDDGQWMEIGKNACQTNIGIATPDESKLVPVKSSSVITSAQMNYLHFSQFQSDGRLVRSDDIFDFNGGRGAGYEWSAGEDGVFIYNGDINTLCYFNSLDSKFHDKYICVYLEGKDKYTGKEYSSYYLGFDFESYHNECGKMVPADGYCDDWIIKIGNAGATQYSNARILCEDLGAYDFDFNDLVIDVDLKEKNNNKQEVKITVRAVGGTIPICIGYGDSHGDVESNAFKKKRRV